jgi:hypothetical protein
MQHFVCMGKVIEHGVVFAIRLAPHHRQPFTRWDRLGANKNASDKAIQFLKQHYLLAKGEKFIFELLETVGGNWHGHPVAAPKLEPIRGKKKILCSQEMLAFEGKHCSVAKLKGKGQ